MRQQVGDEAELALLFCDNVAEFRPHGIAFELGLEIPCGTQTGLWSREIGLVADAGH